MLATKISSKLSIPIRELNKFARGLHGAGYPRPGLKVGVQSVPFAHGQPKAGVDQGPELIKNTGFMESLRDIGNDVKDYGSLNFANCNKVVDELDNGMTVTKNTGIVGLANKLISDSTSQILRDGRICLTLGGDHSIAIGTIHGTSEVYEDLAVLWVDAHADINTPHSTWSGKYHGMSASFNVVELNPFIRKMNEFSWLKPKLRAKNMAYIGLRDVDDLEKKAIEMAGILAFSAKEVSSLGIQKVVEIALETICPSGKRPLHMTYDIDVLDDLEIKSTGTPVPGGLTLREGLTVVEQVRQSGNLVAMDLVEVNPLIGTKEDVERAALVSKQLLMNAFGYYRGGVSTKSFPRP